MIMRVGQDTHAHACRAQRAGTSNAQQRLQQAGLDTQPSQGTNGNRDTDMHDGSEDPIEDSDDENVMHGAPQRRRQVISDSDEDYADMHVEVSTSRGKKRAKVTAASTSRSRKPTR
jgi:hypothetical protein